MEISTVWTRKIDKVNDIVIGNQSGGMDRHNVLRTGCSFFLGLDILRPSNRGTFITSCTIFAKSIGT